MEYLNFNDYILETSNTNEAFFWFIPIIAAAVAVIAIASSDSTETKLVGTKISVLGMQMAGKTVLFNLLKTGNVGNSCGGTSVDYVGWFIYKKPNGEAVFVKDCIDIGGGEENIKAHYESEISKCDTLVFMFNSHKYINDEKYRRDVNARLDLVYNLANGKITDDNIVMVGTHRDLFNDEEKKDGKILNRIKSLIADKPYSNLFNVNFMVVNLLDKQSFYDVANKIFQ